MCNCGLHASVRAIDALKYAPGSVICRVRLGGTIIEDDDKCVASRRTVLWMADAERELRLFACWAARNTPLADGRTVWDLLTDERSRTAVEVAERYADGLATDAELAVVWDAAWTVAHDTARGASQAAAWTATQAAARGASQAAARDAARDAEWNAEWAAARNAAWDAAWDAALDAQNTHLEQILGALGEGVGDE